MAETLIKVDSISKKFCKDLKLGLFYGFQDLTGSVFGSSKERDLRNKEFWAVDDISFEVKRGECLGLLGHNGAGKSTLLKVLTGLIAPDKGRIEMHGRVNALIELTAGFNPILTGRENIYNNAAVLGLTDKEIKAKFDEIVAFSELEEFIDTPVQYYSSGMKVRLGFSVAVHTEPDVLILDEVLSVGDVGFQIKSYNKMREIMKSAAVIFVSHSMPQVIRACTDVVFMRHGKSHYQGNDVSHGIQLYFDEFQGNKGNIESTVGASIDRFFINNTEIDVEKDPVFVDFGGKLNMEFDLTITDTNVKKYFAIIRITDKDMRIVGSINTSKFSKSFDVSDINHVKIEIPELNLIDGEYTISYIITEKNENDNIMSNVLCIYRDYIKFKMRGLELADFAPLYFKANIFQNDIQLNQ